MLQDTFRKMGRGEIPRRPDIKRQPNLKKKKLHNTNASTPKWGVVPAKCGMGRNGGTNFPKGLYKTVVPKLLQNRWSVR